MRCMMIGYHDAAGSEANSLAHTLSSDAVEIRLNGRRASEFSVHALASSMLGVPTVFVSGDRGLMDHVAEVNPAIGRCAVKEGRGQSTVSMTPAAACKAIRTGAEAALRGDLKACLLPVPAHSVLEITYGNPVLAYRHSWYPGARHAGDRTIRLRGQRLFRHPQDAELRDMTGKSQSNIEFILLVALLNAMVAMSIDTMLPAIGTIAAELGATDPNSRQFIITSFFGGHDASGRWSMDHCPTPSAASRRSTRASRSTRSARSCACAAQSFEVMLLGRFVQGFGAAAPRIVSIAMVRDGSAGAGMARVMSFVMTVFMLVPILAPSVGQLVLFFASWRVIFLGFLVMGVIAGVWLWLRQPETLPRSRRSPLSPRALAAAAGEVFRNPVTIGYTIAVGLHLRQLHLLSRNLAAALCRAVQPGRLFCRLVRRLRHRDRHRHAAECAARHALRHAQAVEMGAARLHRLVAALSCCRPSAWTATRRCGSSRSICS